MQQSSTITTTTGGASATIPSLIFPAPSRAARASTNVSMRRGTGARAWIRRRLCRRGRSRTTTREEARRFQRRGRQAALSPLERRSSNRLWSASPPLGRKKMPVVLEGPVSRRCFESWDDGAMFFWFPPIFFFCMIPTVYIRE